MSWAAQIDTKLDKSDAPRHVLDKDLQVLDPSSFQQNLASLSGKPASLPANQGFNRGGFGLVEALDRMTGGLFVLPLAFGALALAVIMTALWWVVIATKIKLEDQALAARRASQRSTATK